MGDKITEKKEAGSNKLFLRLMGFLKPYRFLFTGRIVLSVLNAVMGLVTSYGGSVVVRSATDRNIKYLYTGSAILVVGLIIEAVSTIISAILMSRVSFGAITDIKNLLIEHIQRLPARFFSSSHSGDTTSRLTNDMTMVQDFIFGRLTIYIYYPVRFMAAVVFMSVISWELLLACCIILPVASLLPGMISKRVEKYSSRLQSSLGKVNTSIQDAISGVTVMKSFQPHKDLQSKFDLDNEEAFRNEKKLIKLHAVMEIIYGIARVTPYIACILFGTWLAMAGRLEIYQLTFFVLAVDYLAQPISNIPYMLEAWNKTKGACSRVFELLDEEEEQTGSCCDPAVGLEEPVVVKNLSFSYLEKNPILSGVDFAGKKGEITAFVGESGSGKSTLLTILCGFYTDYTGSVEIMGHELREWNLKELRRSISFVFQDAFLFPVSIYENIAMGKPGAGRDEVLSAAKKANAHDFIMELEKGYETQAGERGIRLSGGQRQRITIARAILKDAPVLILDEATSALDTASEAQVQAAIDNMTQGKTVFIVAHRMSTIKNAAQVVVLDHGRVAGKGSHEELMKGNSIYQKLYKKEMKGEKEAAHE